MNIRYYIDNPEKIFLRLSENFKLAWIPDKLFLKLLFRARMGRKLDLQNPHTYNEKLQWLKLYNRDDLYTTLVDKYSVKQYVSNIIGEEYVIPTLGVWDDFCDIDFDALPNQFVLKCTHDSGGVVICKDKKLFDRKKAEDKLSYHLKHSAYWSHREWPYKGVKPRIIAEKYMEDSLTGELKDYKFFTFNGKVKLMFVASDRQKAEDETKFDFFDEHFTPLPIKQGHPKSDIAPQKPQNYELMVKLSEKLSKSIPHVRVDFYEVNGHVYFGEMTFFHYSGCVPFEPNKWDCVIGDWLVLPNKR